MKKITLFLFLLGALVVFTNCNNDEDEDLTIELTGEYIGAYGSNSSGEINPYEVLVTRVDNDHISVKPKLGNEFDEVEIELVRGNSSIINSPTDNNQQLDKSVVFTIGMPVTMTLMIDPTGNAQSFTGEKQ